MASRKKTKRRTTRRKRSSTKRKSTAKRGASRQTFASKADLAYAKKVRAFLVGVRGFDSKDVTRALKADRHALNSFRRQRTPADEYAQFVARRLEAPVPFMTGLEPTTSPDFHPYLYEVKFSNGEKYVITDVQLPKHPKVGEIVADFSRFGPVAAIRPLSKREHEAQHAANFD